MTTISEYVDAHGITVEELSAESVREDGHDRIVYKLRMRFGRRRLTVPWSQGIMVTRHPSQDPARVFECVLSDACCGTDYAGDPEQFALNYGYDFYDADEVRNVSRILSQCEALYPKFVRFLGGEEAWNEARLLDSDD